MRCPSYEEIVLLKMTQVIVGTFFKTLGKALREAERKNANARDESYVVLDFKNRYLVVSC